MYNMIRNYKNIKCERNRTVSCNQTNCYNGDACVCVNTKIMEEDSLGISGGP